MPITPRSISIILRKRAEAARTDAGYAGSMGDGGARWLEAIADGIDYALDGVTKNSDIKSAIEEMHEADRLWTASQDPDWPTYQRLHAKFKGLVK
jgi:hypothetical protein